jgi:hypothetical protein
MLNIGKRFWKGVLRVLVEVFLNLLKTKVEDKLDSKPRKRNKGRIIRLFIILMVGIGMIGLTAWATKPPEMPPDVIIIRVLPAEDNPYQKEYDEMLSPTVMIETLTGRGSGVVIHHKGTKDTKNTYILTAAHVVGKYAKVDVTFYDYSHQGTKTLNASVVLTDTNKDLALLTTDSHGLSRIYSAKLAKRDYKPYLFAEVWVVGCSLGLDPRPSFGHITTINIDNWEVSAPILPGNSGGPVYDATTHELIGIAVWVRLYGDQLITTMAGIVPISEVWDFLEGYERLQEVTHKVAEGYSNLK